MKLPEKTVSRMPAHLQALFVRLPNPGSEEVVEAFPESAPGSGQRPAGSAAQPFSGVGCGPGSDAGFTAHGDSGVGSAARFFYSAKAGAADRCGSKHPTVKPVDLMRWLVRLVTPPGGVVLDPFAGSGSTGVACVAEGFDAILIEREDEYVADIRRRIAWVQGEGRLTAQEMSKTADLDHRDLPLFNGEAA